MMLGPDCLAYTVRFLEECQIGESRFLKGQIINALAHGVFSAAGKAEVYDWNLDQYVPITDTLPRYPMGSRDPGQGT